MAKLKNEIVNSEAVMIMFVHFVFVFFLLYAAVFLPIWLALVVMLVQRLQRKKLGECFLTAYAHKRGYMKNKTFFSYIFSLLGIKEYRRADILISRAITYFIIAAVSVRAAAIVFH